MFRTSPIYYISPSAISITPNANETDSDLAVYIARAAKIKVYYPPIMFLGTSDANFQEWTLRGRNRALRESDKPYTIYARLRKVMDFSDASEVSAAHNSGYLVFAPQIKPEGSSEWIDPYVLSPNTNAVGIYNHTGADGVTRPWSPLPQKQTEDNRQNYWWIRMGTVSLPDENGKRTVNLDTGILGTDQYNSSWEMIPDAMPMRIELSCKVGGKELGSTPYVYWDESMQLVANLVKGWDADSNSIVKRWTITRNSGNKASDDRWNFPGGSVSEDESQAREMPNGIITLSHGRNADDFAGNMATAFTIKAWGYEGSDEEESTSGDGQGNKTLVALATANITILSETAERYELVMSSSVMSFNPQDATYDPSNGIKVRIRATDQRGVAAYLTNQQFSDANLHVFYAPIGDVQETELVFGGERDEEASQTIPTSAFAAARNLNVRLVNGNNLELAVNSIAFVRNGEDSDAREWIYRRSQNNSYGVLPAQITVGEVNPSGTASGNDSNKNQAGWVPNGWTDDPQGISNYWIYEYESYRDWVREGDAQGREGHWGDFSVPRIRSHYGEDSNVWEIIASETQFHIGKDGKATPLTIPFRIIKITGSLREDKTDEYTDRTIVDYNGTNTQYDISIDEVTSQSFADNTTMATVSVYEEDGFSVVYVGGRAVAKKNGVTLTPLAVATFSVVRDGSDGINVVVADFDDEMHSVACNTDGTPIKNNGVWKTYAKMFLGPEQLKLKSAELVSSMSGISVALTSDKMQAELTVNYYALSYVEEDSLTIRVKLAADNNKDVGYATATVIKVKDGKAVTCNIVTEPTVINVNKKGVPTNCFKDNNGYYIKAFFNVSVNDQSVTRAGFNESVDGISGVAYLTDLSSSNTAAVDDEKIYIQKNSGYADNEIHPLGLELRKYYESQLKVLDMENIPIVRDGSDGITGTSTTLQYSEDPQKYGWHTGFQQNDVWARAVYTDGEGNESYGAAFRIVGENGVNGDYVDYAFAISAEKTTANSTTSPSDISSNQWSDVPQLPTAEKPYQWMRRTPMDGTTKQQKAGEQITYIRLTGEDGADGADGVSSYTWLRYSEDGETFTGEKVDGGLIGDTALLEETVGSALRTTGADLNYFYGANTNPYSTTNGTNKVMVGGENSLMYNKRYVQIITNANGDYALRHSLKGIKPSTWYTLEYYAIAGNEYHIYITNNSVDTSAGAICDGKAFTPTSLFNYVDSNKFGIWRRHVITFKTSATADGSTTGTYLSFQCTGRAAYTFNFGAISLREGKYDFNRENLLYNGDFSDDTNGYVKSNTVTTSIVSVDGLEELKNACRIVYPSGSGTDFAINLNAAYQQRNAAIILGKQIVLSFYARKIGTTQSSLNAWQYTTSGQSYPLTTEWQRFERTWMATTNAPSVNNIAFRATAGTTVELTGIKIELGSVATPWSPSQIEQQFGTAEGAWLGTLVWEHPYPSNNFGDYTWTKIKGEDGQKGGRGAMIRSRGEYVATEGGVNVTYLAGGENEEYLDVVIGSDGKAYQCKKSHGHEIATDDHNYDPITDTTHWQQMNNFENVATKVLFAQLGYVENLGVRYVETTNNGQGMVSISDGVMEVFNAFGSRNIRFGLDENGYAVMQYFDNDGELLYDLGPNGLATSDVRNAVLSKSMWWFFDVSPFTSVLTTANIRKMFGTGQSTNRDAYYFLAKKNAGVKVADGTYVTQGQSINSFDEHYFKTNTTPLDTRNYLDAGYYYQPTAAKFGTAGSNIKTYSGYGSEDSDYANYKNSYPNEYKVTWPTSASDLMSNPLLYVEVYQIANGKIRKKIKVFMRYDKYINDGNINK